MKGWMIFVLAVVLYSVSFFGGFVWDDRRFVEFDQGMGKVSSLYNVWSEPYGSYGEGLYRPMTKFSFYINGFITGYDAWGFHLVNVILYAGLCWILFEVLLKLKIKKGTAFWMAVVFAVLPIHTEVVSNISGRTEILSLGFVLLAIYFLQVKKIEVSSLMFLFALLSKEYAVIGLVILVYLAWNNILLIKNRWSTISLYLISLVIFILLRMNVFGLGSYLHHVGVPENPLTSASSGERVVNAFSLVPFGISKIVAPFHLAYDYSYNQLPIIKNWFDFRVLFGVSLVLLSIASLFTRLRKNQVWVLGQVFFWGPVLITGNFLFLAAAIFSERWYFWPSLGLVMMLGCINISGVMKKFRRELRWIIIIVIVLFSGRTFVRNFDWLSQESLVLHDIKIVNNNQKAWIQVALVHIDNMNYDDAKEALLIAESIFPTDSRLLFTWGYYYEKTNDTENAKVYYQKCVDVEPEAIQCQTNLQKLQ